jgi:nucleotide-binding universal stress UspA family protein
MTLVIVTVDGGPCGWDALEWAVAEADARAARLWVRYTFALHLNRDGYAGGHVEFTGVLDQAERTLREALARSRAIAPLLEVSTELWAGPDAFIGEDPGDGEEVLIVVARERRPRLSWLDPFALLRIASRTQHPVAVAGLFPRADGPSAGRVVLAVECGGDPSPAVFFALRSARRRGVGLTAVNASGRMSSGPFHDPKHCDEPPARMRTWLLSAASLFPEVDVRWSPAAGTLRAGLLEESPGAALIVLGLRNRGPWRLSFPGSLVDTALRSMRAPVVIVRRTAA